MIYFIHSPAMKAVKIGYTGDKPMDRLRSLQTGCPDQLILLLAIPGDQKDEASFHDRFKGMRVQGEWFRECPELMGEIEDRRACLHPSAGTNPGGHVLATVEAR